MHNITPLGERTCAEIFYIKLRQNKGYYFNEKLFIKFKNQKSNLYL